MSEVEASNTGLVNTKRKLEGDINQVGQEKKKEKKSPPHTNPTNIASVNLVMGCNIYY